MRGEKAIHSLMQAGAQAVIGSGATVSKAFFYNFTTKKL